MTNVSNGLGKAQMSTDEDEVEVVAVVVFLFLLFFSKSSRRLATSLDEVEVESEVSCIV